LSSDSTCYFLKHTKADYNNYSGVIIGDYKKIILIQLKRDQVAAFFVFLCQQDMLC